MSVREYVGARYVPIFANPIDWDSTKTYEPLTVVYSNGNSYTSRQYVPAGIDIDNNSYWALTGNYNAQIEAYRNEVLAFDGRIDALEDALPISAFDSADTVDAKFDDLEALLPASEFDSVNTVDARFNALEDRLPIDTADIANSAITTAKLSNNAVTSDKIADGAVTANKLSAALTRAVGTKHMVVIGDSFSTPAYSTEANMWYTAVKRQQNLVVHNYSISGTGYIHPSSLNNNFDKQVSRAINDTSFENDDVRLVIVFGGINDYGSISGNNLQTACFTVLESIIQNFPKAKIIVAGTNTYNTFDRTIYSMTLQLRDAAISQGVSFIDTSWLFFASSYISQANNWHPTDAGQLEIAAMFNSAIAGMPLVKDIYSDYDQSVSGSVGTLRFYRNGYGVYAFGTMRTDASGNCSMKFSNGIGNFVYQPIILVNQNAAKPCAIATFNYSTDTLSITGATPNTSYQIAQFLRSF